MEALPKTSPTLASSPATSQLAPTTTRADARIAGESDVSTEGQGADAFMAALLAQGSLAVLTPPEPAATATPSTVGAEVVAGQVLPLARPALAALLPAALRPTASASVAAMPAGDDVTEVDADDVAGATRSARMPAFDDVAAAVRTAPDAITPRGEGTSAGTATAALSALDFVREGAGAVELTGAGNAITAADGSVVQGTPRPTTTVTENPVYGARHAPLPVAHADLFSERLNQQISVMLSQHNQHARIACAPPELGPVDVRITIVGDEASVQLAAPHAATREALEEALPRLRAALADSGLALGQAGVFADMPQRQQQAAQLAANEHPGAAFERETEAVESPVRMTRLGLVDAFV